MVTDATMLASELRPGVQRLYVWICNWAEGRRTSRQYSPGNNKWKADFWKCTSNFLAEELKGSQEQKVKSTRNLWSFGSRHKHTESPEVKRPTLARRRRVWATKRHQHPVQLRADVKRSVTRFFFTHDDILLKYLGHLKSHYSALMTASQTQSEKHNMSQLRGTCLSWTSTALYYITSGQSAWTPVGNK